MTTLTPIDVKHEDWISVFYSLLYLVDGVKRFNEDEFKKVHTTLLNSTQNLALCSASPPCSTKKKWNDWCTTCSFWRTSILSFHTFGGYLMRRGIFWPKVDSSKWPKETTEVEKCFYPENYSKGRAIHNCDDISITIGKMKNCEEILKKCSTASLDDILNIRNIVSHNQQVTTDDKKSYCDKMMVFLQSPPIWTYPEAIDAHDKIRLFRDKNYNDILKERAIAEHELKMLEDKAWFSKNDFDNTKDIISCDNVTVVTRKGWGSKPPRKKTIMLPPIAWDDVGYNFLIGEDGRVYEGRGWNKVGAHTLGWNNVSVSFAFMGNFNEKEPEKVALTALKNMLAYGVKDGRLTPDFKLYGHRDARPTESPGHYLYAEIQKFPQYDHNKQVKP